MSRNALTPVFDDAAKPDVVHVEDRRREPISAWARTTMLVALGAAAATAVLLGLTASRAYLYAPFADVHDWAADVFGAERTCAWLSYLWKPHTAQRILTARIAEFLDLEVFHGRAPVYLVMSAALWLLGAGSAAVLVLRSATSTASKIYVSLICGLILTDVALAEDLAFPVFSVYLFVAGPALAAASTFALSAERGLRSPMYWASVMLAGVASVGNAAGLAIWPALLGAAVVLRRGQTQCVVMLIAGLTVFGLVEAGLGIPSASSGAGGAGAAHLIKLAAYFLMFAGLPWERALHPDVLACGFGLMIWIAAGRTLHVAWRGRSQHRSPAFQAAAVLILFGLSTAAMAMVGRVDELPTAVVPTHYTPFAALLQIGVVLGLAERIDQAWRERRGSKLLMAGLIGATASILVADLHASRSIPRAAARIRGAGEMLDRGVVSSEVVIYPRPAFAMTVRRELRARGLPN